MSGKSRPSFTGDELDDLSKPRVLISGGGIGGLTLAILLHKANIPFLVFERAKEIKPLGIYDEFVRRGKIFDKVYLRKEDLNLVNIMDTSFLREIGEYVSYMISRPDLYDLLFKNVPRERIHLGKRVLSFIQNDEGVLIQCSDNSTYRGDILVGADGAYSAVGQQLYKDIKEDKKLPKSDDVSLPFSCVCLVGQTEVLDPEEFPDLKNEQSHIDNILGISTMCTVKSSKHNDSFRNSKWGPEAAEALAREVRPFRLPAGKDGKVRTLGEYVDRTPKHLMSKVMHDEIIFDTWYDGRAVLMGDVGVAGAVTAIHDAVALANWISTLRLPTNEDLARVFQEYRAERYPVAKEAFVTSQLFIRNMGKNMLASLVRAVIKRIPQWLWRRIIFKVAAARYQASFLPLVEDRSKPKTLYQPSLHKTLPILKKLAENPAIAATGSSAPVTV
ncbi:hypothetical protein BG003_004540 [Podila horticola]|nr:hypothetical protein BG003_004540 [Podila horticola]